MAFLGSLHNHTDTSNQRLIDSINTLELLVQEAITDGHKYLAITEHESLTNHIEIEKVQEKYPEIKIIRGNEIYLAREGLIKETATKNEKFFHFVLLAKDEIGHRQLRELSSRAGLRGFTYKGILRRFNYYSELAEIIGKNKGHVIGSTACLAGHLAKFILQKEEIPYKQWAKQLNSYIVTMRKIFGEENFFLELQPSHNPEQVTVNKAIVKTGLPYIITTDSHYLNKRESELHSLFLKSYNGERETEFYETTYLMKTEELETFFPYLTREQLDSAYKNIEKIGESCKDYTLRKPLRIPELIWRECDTEITQDWINKIPSLQRLKNSSYHGDVLLGRIIVERLNKDNTLNNQKAYQEIDEEIDILLESSEVNKAHWSAYLLNIQKIIDCCWEAGSLVMPGRGSGVGFLLLYVLDITQVNPLREKTKTYNWRFLNPKRQSVLDIDFDITSLNREKVLDKFREVYGEDRVANVTTIGTCSAKKAIQTAARSLGIPPEEAKAITDLIPSDRGALRTLSQTYDGDSSKGFEPVFQFKKAMQQYPKLWQLAKRLEGLKTSTGTHAGGVIFVDRPFEEYTALTKTKDGVVATQFDLHDAEDVGLIKYDALSTNASDKIQTCIELLVQYGKVPKKETLREQYEAVVGIYNLNRDDPKMWESLWRHEIVELFQMEQRSGVQGIDLIHPKSVDELTVLNSVIRLMAQEKGAPSPLEEWKSYRENINKWYNEMRDFGLAEEEVQWLANHESVTEGIVESQEG